MGLEFISQVIKLTLLTTFFISLGLSFYLVSSDGAAFFLGTVWGCVNLWLIKRFVQAALAQGTKDFLHIVGILGFKFPLLYFAGYLLLSKAQLSAFYVLLGFSSLFISIFCLGFFKAIPKKLTLFAFALFSTAHLHASISSPVPEVPNLITLIYKYFSHSPWATFLHQWESMIFSVIIASFISIIFYLGAKKNALIPDGLQNFIEWIVENLRNFITEILGSNGEKYVPFLGTLFVYILSMNWLVLIPFMKAPSSNFNITAALAICVFVLVQYLNIKHWGVLGFLYHLAGSPKGFLGWALVPLMFVVELLTQFTRPITLALRLFGNVVGEDILIGAFALFGVYFLANYDWPIVLPLQIPFMFLAILTSLMQALVFTLLSTIYISLSMPHSEEETAD